jgi:hypothetical protein
MAGLVPAIHVLFEWLARKAWMPGTRPGMTKSTPEAPMTVSIGHLAPIVALLAGILILIMPRLLNYIVAIYLIVIGIIGLGIFK